MAKKVRAAVLQSKISLQVSENRDRYTGLIEEAKSQGAQIILPPELFQSHYFCCDEKEEHFSSAETLKDSRWVSYFCDLAKKLEVVLPISFFEREGPEFYNSVAVIDADGSVLGVYRKSHIPDGPGYEEKYYFKPGNTGFKVWTTRYANIGVGICWDQWFPEAARCMTLMGAELLLYPTAIGTEPEEEELDTQGPWQRVMQGHAVANAIPVLAANRTGRERLQDFYGASFISDHQGALLKEFSEKEEGVLWADFDLDSLKKYRASFGFFRDRRPDLYSKITHL